MINFLLGFIFADLLFSLLLYLKPNILCYNLNKFSGLNLIIDIFLFVFLIFLQYVRFRK